MKRGQFLAFIPSLFAVPLIGKEIIQEKERITIIKPEPVKIEQPSLTSFDMKKCKVQVVYDDGQVIGEGYLTAVNINYGAWHPHSAGMREIQVEAQLYNFQI